jgi:hypothetical protein
VLVCNQTRTGLCAGTNWIAAGSGRAARAGDADAAADDEDDGAAEPTRRPCLRAPPPLFPIVSAALGRSLTKRPSAISRRRLLCLAERSTAARCQVDDESAISHLIQGSRPALDVNGALAPIGIALSATTRLL